MPTPNEHKLKIALVAMLPEKIVYDEQFERFHWKGTGTSPATEWLHVCWLVEQTLSEKERRKYRRLLSSDSWRERAQALAKVKGVEV